MNATSNGLVARINAAREPARKLVTYRIPPNTATLIAVTPAALESYPGVAVEEIDDAAAIASALDALSESEPENSDRPLDARYGLVFFDAAGERILSAYKGNFATRGQIDAQPCDYNELRFHEWLVARYPLVRAAEEVSDDES